jgi:hypothetical protein
MWCRQCAREKERSGRKVWARGRLEDAGERSVQGVGGGMGYGGPGGTGGWGGGMRRLNGGELGYGGTVRRFNQW